MSLVLAVRVALVSLVGAVWLGLTGCSTPAAKPPPPIAATSADPAAPSAEFERLVQRLLEVEPALTGLLDQIASRLEKPAQIAVERELLGFFTGESFAAAVRSETFFTAPTLLQQFSPEVAALLKNAGLERPLLNLVDDLASLSTAIGESAALTADGRDLQRVFVLIHREVLPTLVEIRALLTEELLDSNEANSLTQRVEEQLQSINEELASLRTRAQSVASPTPSL